jgi:ATP-dependent DNA helicase RecQ
MDHRGHMLESIERGPALVYRQAQRIESVPAELFRMRRRATPAEVDLGFAGSFGSGHRIHGRIEKLRPGDPLELRQRDGKFEVYDREGELIGRMARSFSLPANMGYREASVAAVLRRFEDDSLPEFRGRVRSPAWEVVIPELILEPVEPSGRTKPSPPTATHQELDERAVADQ